MQLLIQNVRLAFPALFEAKRFGEGEGAPAFGAALIFAKNHAAVKELNKAIDAVAKEKWGAKADQVLKALRAQDRTALHDGDTKTQYDGFEGNLYLSTRSKVRPTVIDRDRSPLTQADGKPYAGCYVNARVEIWAQDNKYGKRVNATLTGVQFFADGDAFSGGGQPADAEEFDDLSNTGTDDTDL